MFGDIGHGGIVFAGAALLCYFKDKLQGGALDGLL